MVVVGLLQKETFVFYGIVKSKTFGNPRQTRTRSATAESEDRPLATYVILIITHFICANVGINSFHIPLLKLKFHLDSTKNTLV